MSNRHLDALERVRRGDWDAAHERVQDYSDPLSCLIHAYLHRVEGDLSNAAYWYRQAGEAMPDNEPDEELNRLTRLVQGDKGL